MDNNYYLYHHGTKGMQWGKRLYQNKDGSLTVLGKMRRAKLNKQRAKNLEKARQAKITKKQAELKEKEKELRDAALKEKLLKSTNASELYKNRHLLSTAEINERLNRIDTERRLSQVAEASKKSGMDYVKKAIDTYKTIDNVYSTVSNSSIGKMASNTIAKKLGLNTKTIEKFDLDALVPKLDTMSDEEIKRIAARVENMNKINNARSKK